MKICLLSAVHVWVNPRLVKEADLLAEKGHSVTVITVAQDAWSEVRDRELLKTKRWRALKLDLVKTSAAGRLRWFAAALRQKFFRALFGFFPSSTLWAAESYYRGHRWVTRRAVAERADLYIAHQQATLAAARSAAGTVGTAYAFDCEDLNAVASADGMRDPRVRAAIETLEAACLPGARYVTVTSEPMGRYLTERYRIPAPVVIHNVFPRSEMKAVIPPEKRPMSDKVRMVWISATIGPGRGLEMALDALRRLPDGFELHIFGRFTDAGYEKKFRGALDGPCASRVFFDHLMPAARVLEAVSAFDVGLALEDRACENLALTVTNKYFIYKQAGLAIVATDVPGQRSLWEEDPDSGVLIAPGDAETLAAAMLAYQADRAKLLRAKQASWRSALLRYNWDSESGRFLKAAGVLP